MDDLPALLARDYGVRPQGRGAPMSSSSPSPAAVSSSGASWVYPQPSASADPSAGDPFHGVDIFAGIPGVKSRKSDFDLDFLGQTGPSVAKDRSAASGTGDGLGDFLGGFGSSGATASKRSEGKESAFDDLLSGFGRKMPPTERGSKNVTGPARYDDDLFGELEKNSTRLEKGNVNLAGASRFDGDDFLGGFGVKPAAGGDNVDRNVPSAPRYDDELVPEFRKKAAVEGAKTSGMEKDDDDLLRGFGKVKEGRNKFAEESTLGDFSDLMPGFSAGVGSGQQKNRKLSDMPHKSSQLADPPRASLDTFDFLERANSSANSSAGLFSEPLRDSTMAANFESKRLDDSAADILSNNQHASDSNPLPDPLFYTKGGGSSKDNISANISRDRSPMKAPKNQDEGSFKDDFVKYVPETQTRMYEDNMYTGGTQTKSPDGYTRSVLDDQSPRSTESDDDVWLSVSEIPLFTRPTSAPPPSRSPPLLVSKHTSFGANAKGSPRKYGFTQTDEAESSAAASAAAMKNAMSYAEATFRHAKEVREREKDAKLSSSRGAEQQDADKHEILKQAREQRLRVEKEDMLEKETKERERRAFEIASKEARQRAAADALEKAERERRQQQERAAVKRAQAEARERLATEAAKRAAAAAKGAADRTAGPAKGAADRTAGPVRPNDGAPSVSAVRESQSGAGAFRANSAPKQRSTAADPMSDFQAQAKTGPGGSQNISSVSTMGKAQPTKNIMDDLSSGLFGDENQDTERDNEERRRARFERDQRTQERAAKALAEKYERDLQQQREQEERHRFGESLDFQIKRWSAGKEGNLLALLSTLHYILWPECGWQPVSIADLMTASAMKKHYHKAALCIHPDKMQQKGATLQQKYVAEKVFDLLKEAWNKYNT